LNDDDADINRAWESVRANIRASATESPGGYNELKQHELWVDGKCSVFNIKGTRLNWFQNPTKE